MQRVSTEDLPKTQQLAILQAEYGRATEDWLRIVRSNSPKKWERENQVGSLLQLLERKMTTLKKEIAHA